MKTKYIVQLTDGTTVIRESKVPDYVAAVQGVTWTGVLTAVSFSKTLGGAFKTAATLSKAGMSGIKVLPIERV